MSRGGKYTRYRALKELGFKDDDILSVDRKAATGCCLQLRDMLSVVESHNHRLCEWVATLEQMVELYRRLAANNPNGPA